MSLVGAGLCRVLSLQSLPWHPALFRLVADTDEGPVAVSAGNIVSLATKPVQYGRILHFGIDEVRVTSRCLLEAIPSSAA